MQQLTREQQEQAKQRRLKEPLEITGYEVEVLKVKVRGAPQTTQRFATRRIQTIGDLARLDAHAKIGKFIPMPDLSLQALLIVIDRLGMLEPEPGPAAPPAPAGDPKIVKGPGNP